MSQLSQMIVCILYWRSLQRFSAPVPRLHGSTPVLPGWLLSQGRCGNSTKAFLARLCWAAQHMLYLDLTRHQLCAQKYGYHRCAALCRLFPLLPCCLCKESSTNLVIESGKLAGLSMEHLWTRRKKASVGVGGNLQACHLACYLPCITCYLTYLIAFLCAGPTQ